jgi:intracellular multiplication protein IcmK
LPLDDRQIRQYRQRADLRDKALSPAAPSLKTRTVLASLEPGNSPVVVNTTLNVATSLVFHDSTGKAWPISSVTNGAAAFFTILRPEIPEANLLNVIPLRDYGSSTLVVTLAGRDVPLVIRLDSDGIKAPERSADGLVLFRIGHPGPNAEIPSVAGLQETVTSDMLAFLDKVPPKGATLVKLDLSSRASSLWLYQDTHFLRTSDSLVWPAWKAVVNGAGDVKCYELPVTSRLLIAKDGQVITYKIRVTSLSGE